MDQPSDALPKSVRERYSTHKKRDEKQASKEENKRESNTSAASEGLKQPSKWSSIYGEASKQIGKLIDKQSERLQAKEDAGSGKQDKKSKQHQKNDAPKKSEGSQPLQQQKSFKKEKKPKYYLGSSIGGDKKFNAF